MFTAASRQRIVALVVYFVTAVLILGFLLPLHDGFLAFVVALCYVPISMFACAGAFRLPLSHCTIIKAVGLASIGALLPLVIIRLIYYPLFRAA